MKNDLLFLMRYYIEGLFEQELTYKGDDVRDGGSRRQ